METELLHQLYAELKDELLKDILPFWSERMQDTDGGFYPQMDGKGKIIADAPRGGILNARILWTFSSARRMFPDNYIRDMSDRAFGQIKDFFYDKTYGGTFWSIGKDGQPAEDKKQFYALAFTVYGLAEYYRATRNKESLDLAVKIFGDIEAHSYDSIKGGYLEAAERDWSPIADMRLSDKDRNDAKTMNTHLHILEAYTNLYRVWPDKLLRDRLKSLVELFLEKIVRPDGHLGLFYDEMWNSTSDASSYGHDIETSWLLCESAEVLGDSDLSAKVKEASKRLALASLDGLKSCGGMIYEFDPSTGVKEDFYEWWVQAELVVGCINQYRLTSDNIWLERALAAWNFIKKYIICPDGEWYWGADSNLKPDTKNDRAGFWKCPYHNGRMCMEIISYYIQTYDI